VGRVLVVEGAPPELVKVGRFGAVPLELVVRQIELGHWGAVS